MKRIELMFVLVASLVFGACSTDDDNNNDGYTVDEISEAPVWQVDWNNDQERPNWTDPNASAYENWTIMMVQIEDELTPFVSENDLMAMFINDELRGLASPAVSVGGDESISNQFLMKAYGNETGSETVNVKLSYYCQKLKHMFTLSANISKWHFKFPCQKWNTFQRLDIVALIVVNHADAVVGIGYISVIGAKNTLIN